MVTVRGEIDGVNAGRVGEYIRRFVLGTEPVVLDLSDVSLFAAAGISLLYEFDEECQAAGAEWTLVASPAVIELLNDAGDGAMFPMARSVQEALRNLAEAIVRRRQFVLPLIKKTA